MLPGDEYIVPSNSVILSKKLQRLTMKTRSFWGGDLAGKHKGDTDRERCLSNQKCRFVLDHAGFNLIDARITHLLGRFKSSSVNGTEKEENGGRQYH
jgi:hypothetical protein